jgi:hypothetical protein
VLKQLIKKSMQGIIRWAVIDEVSQDKMNYANESKIPSSTMIGQGSRVQSLPGSSLEVGGMNFTVYSATGGKVIEFKTYDPRIDRHISSLYVITEREDLGEELAQIITKETLTR